MLTGKQVRVRYARDRIVPMYLDTRDPMWREAAEQLLGAFRNREGATRRAVEEDQRELFGDDPNQLVYQGLAKLLEDRCEFEIVSGQPPEVLREAVFRAATAARLADATLDRAAVLAGVAIELRMSPEAVEAGLFADLKSEQRLTQFKDISAEHLLNRYNVALAQAVLLRATAVHLTIRKEPPQRLRQLLRRVKFHRLVCEVEKVGTDGMRLTLDGPLSLFSATQKYGLQLALFLPAVLHCRDFDLAAELRWGPARKPKQFLLSAQDRLVSHHADAGMYVAPELAMFADLFRKKIADWELVEESAVVPLGDGFWVPDFRLTHRETGRAVLLEVLGFWRRASAEKHLARLRLHATEPFLLAVSDQLHVDDSELEGLPADVHRFRNMPLPDDIARLAAAAIEQQQSD